MCASASQKNISFFYWETPGFLQTGESTKKRFLRTGLEPVYKPIEKPSRHSQKIIIKTQNLFITISIDFGKFLIFMRLLPDSKHNNKNIKNMLSLALKKAIYILWELIYKGFSFLLLVSFSISFFLLFYCVFLFIFPDFSQLRSA
jgi:hypothetical protein